MTRLVWVTDIHLNFVDPEGERTFFESVAAASPDALAVGGDIAEGPELCEYLSRIEEAAGCPVYFVLGNHDFYRGSIHAVRRQAAELARSSRQLVYLSQSPPVRLSEATVLVGHDGWGDARLGDYEGSSVVLSDFFAIAELAEVQWDRALLRRRLAALGLEAADHLRGVLPEALDMGRRIVVLTHVPPFAEAAWHEGKPSAADWLPYFSCWAVGDVLREAAVSHPDRQLLVLCGHTHGGGEAQILDNLRVLTGAAQYGQPRVSRVLELE